MQQFEDNLAERVTIYMFLAAAWIATFSLVAQTFKESSLMQRFIGITQTCRLTCLQYQNVLLHACIEYVSRGALIQSPRSLFFCVLLNFAEQVFTGCFLTLPLWGPNISNAVSACANVFTAHCSSKITDSNFLDSLSTRSLWLFARLVRPVIVSSDVTAGFE